MRPGQCIDIWEGEGLLSAAYLGEDKGRLRVLTAQGKELKVAEARVANEGGREVDRNLASAALARLVAERESAVVARGQEVDVASLWEVVVDQGGSYTLADLAELALGEKDGEARAALLRRLVQDSIHFSRKRLEFVPKTREELGETLKRLSAEEEKLRRRAEFIAAARAFLASGAAPPAPDWPKGGERFVAAIRDLAVNGLECKRIPEALKLLEDLGAGGRGEPPHVALEVLVRFGVFGPDENLLVQRYAIRRDFSPAILEEARALADAGLPSEPGRRDLRHLECIAIDDAETSEVDDALSLQDLGAGRWRLGIHIAEPSHYVPQGSAVDLTARDRATTYYLPEERILMLPAVLSEAAASLRQGVDAPTLTFFADLDPRGELLGSELCLSIIRIARRLTYEAADRAVAAGGGAPSQSDAWDAIPSGSGVVEGPVGIAAATSIWLAQAARLARALTERRAEAGALILKGPDLDLKVRDGQIRLRRVEPWTPAWVLVSESMILANRIAAEMLAARGVPAIFRRQPPPEQKLVVPAVYEPAAAAAARKGIKRTEIGLTPAPHAGLGLKSYVQATSPIRRYQDLACQRQLKAILLGQPPPFDRESMWAVAQATDEAEKQAREVERDRREYWLFKHLESLAADRPLEAVITRAEERRTLIEIEEFVHIAQIPRQPGHKPGRRIRVVVDAVNPRAGRLVLREVG